MPSKEDARRPAYLAGMSVDPIEVGAYPFRVCVVAVELSRSHDQART